MQSRERLTGDLFGVLEPEMQVGHFNDPPEVAERGSYWEQHLPLKFVDLFSGIGGFHIAAASLGMKCILASEVDPAARHSYHANFGILPRGDIRDLEPKDMQDVDLIFGGFPCQPFSIIGKGHGFTDDRGALFFETSRLIAGARPKAFVLENVRRLATHDRGETLRKILVELKSIGYRVQFRVLNALDFGLPQKRERIIIVGFRDPELGFNWPTPNLKRATLSDVLEPIVGGKYFVSEKIRNSRHRLHEANESPAIWHENKSGSVSSHPYSCALRAGASHNYLLVDGMRRLTPREMLRLQGFPDTFRIVCSDAETRKQAGNAVPVPLIRSVLAEVLKTKCG